MALPRRSRWPTAQTSISSNSMLIELLFDEIESRPPAIEARIMLMQQWINAGELDAAENTAQELLGVDPSNAEARKFLRSRGTNIAKPKPESSSIGGRQGVSSYINGNGAQPGALHGTAGERTSMERELSQGYAALLARANTLLQESRLVQEVRQREHITAEPNSHVHNLKAIVDGRVHAVVSSRPPRSARAVARSMEADPDGALDIVVADFADMVRWLRSATNNAVGVADYDSLRQSLMKRVSALSAALPAQFQQIPAVALMHVEHEDLDRSYVNSETMLLEPVADIPRANFWVSEDGYAWDMDELAKSLASNGGVMRNPLSRQMFSVDDVRAIVQHPLGKHLQAMRVEQSSLSRGVRTATIDRLDQLSATLLNDQSDDQVPSRQAIDDFLQYTATLPYAEQRVLDTLRVPATDSHTGQAFDCTIGEAVRDGKANKICLHKTGDLIGQAVRHLRQSNRR